MADSPIAAAGNWRYVKERMPGEGGRYLVRIEFDGAVLYNVAGWDGRYWDMLPNHITHWAPLYSIEGIPA